MLPHALLLLYYSEGYIGIPVKNFPMLPIGSSVEVHVSEKFCFEDACIEAYSVDSENGVQIELKIRGYQSGNDEEVQEKKCVEIATECVKDPSFLVELIYPHEIDFGIKCQIPVASEA